ncbi:protein eva-1 homolog C-like isoform X1 [Alligator sinensis]|uniref:Protein eva-1 homolog C-like isoform X1 n=1 Tax=Alligator sinensis TaxID=38654 RepID=A0A1U7SJ15_ALLSI|nr:protein eva-1 homolog C-like isoform X1 [Alligator sinensis]
MEDSVKSLAKGKVYHIHCSSSNPQSLSLLIIEKNQVGQVWLALDSCWMFLMITLFSSRCITTDSLRTCSMSFLDCLSYTALDVLSKRCYGKQRCKIVVSHNDFGSPCLPGVKKYLNVNYTCVPKIILTAVDPMVANLNPTLNQKDSEYDINFDPKGSRSPKKDGTIVSSSLATFAYIRDHPERAALLFVSSVCIGLVFTLCALVVRVSCTNDFQRLHRIRTHFEPESDQADGNSENDEEEDSSDSDFPDELTGFCRTHYSGYNSTEAAELAERIERREQIIQEIWMNSGLDMTPPRSIDPFYIPKQ